MNHNQKIIKYKSVKQIKIEQNTIEQLYMWDFDFDFYKYKSKSDLILMAYNMFDDLFYNSNADIKTNFVDKIDKLKLHSFICHVSIYYYDTNSYHNFSHAVSVIHFLYMMIKTMNISTQIDEINLFALMISALIHDIDHPGHTNLFEINSETKLAKKYNNKSILENHHCEFGLNLINLPKIKLLNNLSHNEQIIFKEIITKSIMSTDMFYHNKLVDKLKQKNISQTNKEINKQILLCQGLLHLSDLCNSFKPFDTLFNCINLLQQEHINQIKKEKENNIFQSIHLVKQNDNLFNSEINFEKNIVLPLCEELEYYFPMIKILNGRIQTNIKIWQRKIEEIIDL